MFAPLRLIPQTEPAPQAASTETPPEGLTEVYIIGMKYIDYFTDGTTEYSFPGDPEIHAHIAEKDAPIPTREGMTWVRSAGYHLYDTASGDLEEGQYAIQPNGSIIAKHPPFQSSTSTPAALPPTPEPAPAEPAIGEASTDTTEPPPAEPATAETSSVTSETPSAPSEEPTE